MKPTSHELLAETLGETESTDFRCAVLESTLMQARRRRISKQLQRATVPIVALIAFAVLSWWSATAFHSKPRLNHSVCPIVRTQPFRTESIVSTTTLDRGRVIVSAPFLAQVSTSSFGAPVRLLNDAELLALVGPRPAVLIRVGPREQRLIFVDEEKSRQVQ